VDNSRPLEARTQYLNGKSAEEKAAVLERASRQGPGPQDADWVVAKACDDAAKRIEAATPMTAKTLEAIVGQLDVITQRCDDLAKRPAPTPAGYIEPADPLATAARYFGAFVAGAIVFDVLFYAVSFNWLPPRVSDQLSMFCLGLTATAAVLLWLWLAPIVKARRR
jgi:hypothetical protein